ncbi:hypothetical protein PV726_32575 [Streptomyces europaeiscabiei]|uniref:hypothetical protein n=1 Tax=Streptomyces europaeiscabiei TaxID=146819 RepID=UPI0029AB21CC|nr:hypothetical protein [Streptomyces europaeiscabiei]MDX3694994.1 hypothetical protein [Streptomyces europaeiscabiei]
MTVIPETGDALNLLTELFSGIHPDADTHDVAPTEPPAAVPALHPVLPDCFSAPRPAMSRIGSVWHFAAMGTAYRAIQVSAKKWKAHTLTGDVIAEASTRAGVGAAVVTSVGADRAPKRPAVRHRTAMAGLRLYVTGENHELALASVKWGQYAELCVKCGGNGRINAYQHVQGGVCFACAGEGTVGAFYTEPEAVAAVFRMDCDYRAKADRDAIKWARQSHNLQTFYAAHPEIAAWMTGGNLAASDFGLSLRDQIARGRTVTDRQLAAAREAAAREADRKAQAERADAARLAVVKAARPAGAKGEKVTVTGTVTRAWTYYTGPPWAQRAKRGIVVDDGRGVAVIMFTSAAAAFSLQSDDPVTVTATVKDPANRDRDTGAIQTLVKSPKFTTA